MKHSIFLVVIAFVFPSFTTEAGAGDSLGFGRGCGAGSGRCIVFEDNEAASPFSFNLDNNNVLTLTSAIDSIGEDVQRAIFDKKLSEFETGEPLILIQPANYTLTESECNYYNLPANGNWTIIQGIYNCAIQNNTLFIALTLTNL